MRLTVKARLPPSMCNVLEVALDDGLCRQRAVVQRCPHKLLVTVCAILEQVSGEFRERDDTQSRSVVLRPAPFAREWRAVDFVLDVAEATVFKPANCCLHVLHFCRSPESDRESRLSRCDARVGLTLRSTDVVVDEISEMAGLCELRHNRVHNERAVSRPLIPAVIAFVSSASQTATSPTHQ